MKSRLDRIGDWEERLRNAKWQARALSTGCGLTERELRRFIHSKFGLRLHLWIRGDRMEHAAALLRQGAAVKEVSAILGYEQASHFSRDFKSFYGITPGRFASAGERL
ncbi:MAG: helix-turn-helix domain-containing protein [Limisphaerales bacterium]